MKATTTIKLFVSYVSLGDGGATYWKNGEIVTLENLWSEATSIYVVRSLGEN